ncbi:MAG: hypothetical protein ABI551_22415 [Polyangiaceae bacterium]
MKRLVATFVAVLTLALAQEGCATYHDELARGETAFEANEHEKALAIFRALEPDLAHLDHAERARYDYLRGMTDYRIGYKTDARHWLLLAMNEEKEKPGTLPNDWKHRLEQTVNELDAAVFDDVASARAGEDKTASEAATTKSGDVP